MNVVDKTLVVLALLLSAASMAGAQQDPLIPKGTANIRGQVTRSDTGQPITNATVQIVPVGISAMGTRVKVDAQGRFELKEIGAGSYVLNVTADGFVNLDAMPTRPAGAGKPITVKDGDQIANANIVMAPAGIIEGRTLDEFGDPAPGVTVQLAQMIFTLGKTRLMPVAGNRSTGPTDDLGRFRFFSLSPGDYYVLVLSGPFGLSSASAFSTPVDTRLGFAPTYFPGTSNAAEAKPVHLDAGKQALDVIVPLVPARMATLSGTLADLAGRPVAQGGLMLLQTQGGDVRAIIPANTSVGSNGMFTYRNVPFGTYVIQGFTPAGFGALLVTVDREAMTDLVVTTRPLTTARGHLVFEGDAPKPSPNRVSVTIGPTDFVSGPVGGNRLPSHVNDDWTFDVSQIPWMGVLVMNAPPPWLTKRVTVGGQEISPSAPYDFRQHDVDDIEVVLTSRVASVTGTVSDQGGPAAGCLVIVFPDDTAPWFLPQGVMGQATSNADGTFKVAGLLAGSYRAVALPASFRPDPSSFQTFLTSLRAEATPLILSEGETATISLKPIKR